MQSNNAGGDTNIDKKTENAKIDGFSSHGC
jgi:hypothetical protein